MSNTSHSQYKSQNQNKCWKVAWLFRQNHSYKSPKRGLRHGGDVISAPPRSAPKTRCGWNVYLCLENLLFTKLMIINWKNYLIGWIKLHFCNFDIKNPVNWRKIYLFYLSWHYRDGPWPEHTSDPQWIRGQSGSDLGIFWPDPMIFFWIEDWKFEKFWIFVENFPDPEMADWTQPNTTWAPKKSTSPGQKRITQTHHKLARQT